MDSTPLFSHEESVARELFNDQPVELSLSLLTHPHGQHSSSAHDSHTTALLPRHISDFSYDFQMPNAHINNHASVQDVYSNRTADALAIASLTPVSLPRNIDPQENHPSTHNSARSRTDRILRAPMLPPSTLPGFPHPSGNAPLGTVFSRVQETGFIDFDTPNPAMPSTYTFSADSSSHNVANIPGELEPSDRHRTASLIVSPPAATSDNSSQQPSSSTSTSTSTASEADSHETERSCTASSDTVVDQSIAHIPGATQKRWRCCYAGCKEPEKAKHTRCAQPRPEASGRN